VRRHPVDHHRAALHEVPAEVGRGDRHGQADRAERPAGRPVAGEAGGQRGALQEGARRVEQAVEEPGPPVLRVADAPVGDAGGRGRGGGREAGRAERRRRVEARAGGRHVLPGRVEQQRRRPQPDREVAERGVQGVPEPPSAVHHLEDRVAAEAVVHRVDDGGGAVGQVLQPRPPDDLGE
jgi:hypothetical protein